jgi:hypothetical protein
MIVALSGKMRCGKTTLATELLKLVPGMKMSFADPVREEVAALLGVGHSVVQSTFFKSANFVIGNRIMTGREVLQWWGTEIRRAADPDYWVNKLKDHIREHFYEEPTDLIVVDDMRFISELELLRELGAFCVRINPYSHWTPGPNADHSSETALDGYHGWDLVVAPEYGEIAGCAHQIRDLLVGE